MIYFKILFIILLAVPIILLAGWLYYATAEYIRKLNYRDRKKKAIEQAARSAAESAANTRDPLPPLGIYDSANSAGKGRRRR